MTKDLDKRNNENVFLKGDDEEQQREEEKPRPYNCCWSRYPGPEDLYSDWKIVVKKEQWEKDVRQSKDVVAIYSVHRLVLGPQSGRFDREFRKHGKHSERHSTIVLRSQITRLAHLETLLDFVYGKRALQLNDGDNAKAIAMLYLADSLEIKALKRIVETFVRTTLRAEDNKTLAFYYLCADRLPRTDLKDAVLRYMCDRLPYIPFGDDDDDDSVWWKIVDVPFWFRMWEERKRVANKNHEDESIETCEDWSRVFSWYLSMKGWAAFDATIFLELTSIRFLPYIAPAWAVFLMEAEQAICWKHVQYNNKNNMLTCLQKRCMEALYDRASGKWRTSMSNDTINARYRIRNLPRVVESTLVLWTVQHNIRPTSNTPSGYNKRKNRSW